MHTTDLILRHETLLRICSFLTIMFIMWRWEIAFPKRPLNVNKPMRWANNLGLLFLNSLVYDWHCPLQAWEWRFGASKKVGGYLILYLMV